MFRKQKATERDPQLMNIQHYITYAVMARRKAHKSKVYLCFFPCFKFSFLFLVLFSKTEI